MQGDSRAARRTQTGLFSRSGGPTDEDDGGGAPPPRQSLGQEQALALPSIKKNTIMIYLMLKKITHEPCIRNPT